VHLRREVYIRYFHQRVMPLMHGNLAQLKIEKPIHVITYYYEF
jgi:hypothetical protein